MPPHGDAQQTKVEPHHHADGQSQREDVSAFNDRKNDTGFANGSTEGGVLDQLTPFKNRHPWRPFFGRNVEQERIPLLAKEEWPRHQEDDAEGHQRWRGRRGQSSKRVWNAFRNISSQMTTPSAPLSVASRLSPNRVYRLTFPRAAMIESETPTWRDFMMSRSSRISRRTLSFSLQTQAIGRKPFPRAYCVERSSV